MGLWDEGSLQFKKIRIYLDLGVSYEHHEPDWPSCESPVKGPMYFPLEEAFLSSSSWFEGVRYRASEWWGFAGLSRRRVEREFVSIPIRYTVRVVMVVPPRFEFFV